MTEEKQNIAIYKLLGYKPVKSWKFYHDKEKTRASLGFRTKRDALEWIEREKNSWPYTQFPQEYEFSEPEEYEDWSYCPQVDLDLLNRIELEIIPQTHRIQYALTPEFISKGRKNDLNNFGFDPFICHTAKIKHRRESILKTLNLWEE